LQRAPRAGRSRRHPEIDEPIWARPEPGARRPRFTREAIAERALAIADAEGLEAVSMRRVAAELRAGTMTLYHYVRNKRELQMLMEDAIMAELVVPDDELPEDDWRAAFTAIATRTHEVFKRHAWAIQGLRGTPGGPNSLRHVEQSLAAAAGTGLDLPEQIELIAMVDDYVFGFGVRESEVDRDAIETALDDPSLDRALAYFDSLIESGEYPRLRELRGEGDPRESWRRLIEVMIDARRFDRGLDRLLDGIERDVERRRRERGAS
jgi:AcrR family transcriptional regulator